MKKSNKINNQKRARSVAKIKRNRSIWAAFKSLFTAKRKRVSYRYREQFLRDLSKMTNWQNSQWLRAGSDRNNTKLFLGMTKANRKELLGGQNAAI